MQHNAYTHGGTIGIGGSVVNANDFSNSHSSSNNSHVLNAIQQTSLPQSNSNNNINSNNVASALMATTSSRGDNTGATSPASGANNASVSAVNYGTTFFGNEYHHQLTQTALMANPSTYAAAASTAASTAMLTNYCDAAMMMAAAAVNANQCLQQQQQRMALMVNCQSTITANGSRNEEHDDLTNLNKNSSPANNDAGHQSHNNSTPLVSTALSSVSSTTSTTSSSLSLPSTASTSSTTSPAITLVNTASLIATNVANDDVAASVTHVHTHYSSHANHHNELHHPQQHHLQHHQLHHVHHHQHNVEPVTSPNLNDISEVPLIVDVK